MIGRPILLGIALATAVPVPALAAPAQVRLGWQGPTDSTMTVTWRSAEPAGTVELGADAGYGSVVQARSVAYEGSWLHEAELVGLRPETTYHYRCGTAGSWSVDRTFTTGPAPGPRATFRFAAYGDSRTDDAARARVRAAVQARAPAFSIDTGDLVDSGAIQSQWDQWFTTMEPLLATTPFVPIAGNHEASSPKFYAQFAMPRHAPSGDEPEAYYSFDYGSVHLVGLSTEPAPGLAGSAQYAWLEADLARAAADPDVRWTVVYFHRPPYSSGAHGSDLAVRAGWGPLFERYGVDLVFTGHDHHYERTHPMVAGRAVAEGGVVYVVSGGAGAPLRDAAPSDFTAAIEKVHHFAEVSVTANALTLEARDEAGAVFDAVTLVHASPLGDPPGAPTSPDADPGGPGGGGVDVIEAPRGVARSAGCGVSGGGAAFASTLALALAAVARRRR